MSRFEFCSRARARASSQGHAGAHRGRALALTFAALLAGACGGDDDGDKHKADGGSDASVKNDGSVRMDASVDASIDAGRDSGHVGQADASIPPTRTKVTDPTGNDAPTIDEVGFYTDVQLLLIGGSDKNGDIKTYTIEFFDAMNKPVAVSVSGDSADTGSTSYTPPADYVIPHDSGVQEFVLNFMSSLEFFMKVDNIKVTVEDSKGNKSAVKTAKKAASIPVKRQNVVCSTDGFDRCASELVCAPAKDKWTCQPAPASRTAACTSDDVLTLSVPGKVTGTLGAASLWDPPTGGCVGGTGSGTGNIDRVVKLTVTQQTAQITLSTSMSPELDSILYKLDKCDTNLPACTNGCACSEADLVLTNVAPGDYFIVVDTSPPAEIGQTFTLTAQ